ncbi:MAG: hypothetical protein K2N73_11295 [Lachnospiraceae bacterium]|nr:hypothetical protein [Lachnospiraceae bacterium]
MSIADMTNVSCFLFAVSGLAGMAAVALFFVLDISRCWRMVSGKIPVHIKKQKTDIIKTEKISGSEAAGECDATVALGGRTEYVLSHDREEVICRGTAEGMERTALLGLEDRRMILIQDIVYIQGEKS